MVPRAGVGASPHGRRCFALIALRSPLKYLPDILVNRPARSTAASAQDPKQRNKKGTCGPFFISGARVDKVDEPLTTFVFELEAYPEPKILSSNELKALYGDLRSYKRVAALVGASEAFVRQACNSKRYKNSKKQSKTKGEK